jgi:hypothetical protein
MMNLDLDEGHLCFSAAPQLRQHASL